MSMTTSGMPCHDRQHHGNNELASGCLHTGGGCPCVSVTPCPRAAVGQPKLQQQTSITTAGAIALDSVAVYIEKAQSDR